MPSCERWIATSKNLSCVSYSARPTPMLNVAMYFAAAVRSSRTPSIRCADCRRELLLLPDASDLELVQLWIDADDGDIKSEGLRGDHAVGGIAVNACKTPGTQRNLNAERQKRVACFSHALHEVPLKSFSVGEFSDSYLVGNFPCRN